MAVFIDANPFMIYVESRPLIICLMIDLKGCNEVQPLKQPNPSIASKAQSQF